MIKAIAVVVGLALTLTLAIGGRWFTVKAKKRKLMSRIREIEYEMCVHDVGADAYNQLKHRLRQLNQEYADICRNE